MKRQLLVGIAVLLLAVGAAAQGSRQVPMFQVDPTFFKIPSRWILGQGSAVAVDSHDNVWIFHRPRYIPADQRAQAAPPVLEFDSSGKFLQGWGGPADGYDWPDQEHGIYVDDKDNVWLTGSARPALLGPGDGVLRSDNMILEFTNKGKFLMQIGHRDQSEGNKDTKNVYSATDVFLYRKTNELFVADGYINRRLIVFDPDTGAFKRMWGAFGNVPEDPPDLLKDARTPARPRASTPAAAPAGGRPNRASLEMLPQFIGAVHAVKVSSDGLVYVADRSSARVQVFTVDGKYLKQFVVDNPAGIALSPDPDQRFMYVVNMAGSKVVVVDRKRLEVLYQFGARSEKPGDFRGVHHISIDSKGNLYTAEAEPGNRFQKFVFKGLGNPPT
jgi:hypothetical protein